MARQLLKERGMILKSEKRRLVGGEAPVIRAAIYGFQHSPYNRLSALVNSADCFEIFYEQIRTCLSSIDVLVLNPLEGSRRLSIYLDRSGWF